MTRRMTKREIKRYEKRLQEEATMQDPKRNRKLVRVLFVLSANWAQHTALFTEEVTIVDKKLYDIDELKVIDKYKNISNGYVNEENKIGTISVDYGKINYGYIWNHYNTEFVEDGVATLICKQKDFDSYNIGDKIKVYVFWSRGYDGTEIRLFLYDVWEKHIPKIITGLW